MNGEVTIDDFHKDACVIVLLSAIAGFSFNGWLFGDSFTMVHNIFLAVIIVGLIINIIIFEKKYRKLKKMMK